MDRNTLLKSSRAKFISIFNELIEGVVHQSIETLFEKADKSFNSLEQRQFIDARGFIVRNEKLLVDQIINNLEILLDRSFQTAYDTFRPSFFNAAKASPIVLLDVGTFEDDLRLELITSRFRSEAGGQLRDLNIRIAILFECNDIAERENPFRPYLLTRAIVLAVEATQAESELSVLITDQLGEELLRKVTKLYEGVNLHLSDAGVAAQLQFKPQRPYGAGNLASDEDQSLVELMQARKALQPDSINLANQNTEQAVSNQFARIENLLSTIKLRQQNQTKNQTKSRDGDFPEINCDLLDDDNTPNSGKVGGLLNQAGATVSGWLEGVQEVGDALRRVFLGGNSNEAQVDGVNESGERNTIEISPRLNKALRTPLPALSEMQGVGGEVRNLLIESRDNLNALASNQNEKMTIDIVAMLFEFILNDHQVPAEVRAQLGRLQFSVLKMALMDSALLTKKSHPARLLVNRIGSISLGLQQIDPSGERISAEICLIVEELLASDAESPELFSKMLDQLDVFIARELLASNAHIENAVNLVASAENRSKRFEQISTKLEKLLDAIPTITVDPYLRRFLLGTWSHAIERAERNSNANPPCFRQLIPELVWSLLPKVSQEDRCLLLQVLPKFVLILREGMNLAEYPPGQQQELLDWLVDAHTAVIRDGAMNESAPPSLVEVQAHFQEFVNVDHADAVADVVESTSLPKKDIQRIFVDEALKELETELSAAGVLENLDSTPEFFDHHAVADEESEESDVKLDSALDLFQSHLSENDQLGEMADADSNKEDILDRLRSGVVVEINLSGIPTLGRLNWISPNSSNLILTLHGQAAPSVISVRMFRRMLKSARARFIEVAPLFERAVQSLLESADLVDLTHSS